MEQKLTDFVGSDLVLKVFTIEDAAHAALPGSGGSKVIAMTTTRELADQVILEILRKRFTMPENGTIWEQEEVDQNRIDYKNHFITVKEEMILRGLSNVVVSPSVREDAPNYGPVCVGTPTERDPADTAEETNE